jgi:hypothetical protein
VKRERGRYVVVRGREEGVIGEVCRRTGCGVSVARRLQPDGLVLRCSHVDLPKVRGALSEMGVEVLGVSGTIRGAVRKFWKGGGMMSTLSES